MVPPLLLHPLVENAIRHGVARRVQGGRLGIRARREHGRLELRIWDDGRGAAVSEGGTAGSGIGLANTRARLQRLYGGDQRLELQSGPAGGVQVSLSLPFRTQAPVVAAEGERACAP